MANDKPALFTVTSRYDVNSARTIVSLAVNDDEIRRLSTRSEFEQIVDDMSLHLKNRIMTFWEECYGKEHPV